MECGRGGHAARVGKLVALKGEPVRGDAHRCGQARRLLQGPRRHHGAAQGGRLSDQRQAHASGARTPGDARREDRRERLRQSYARVGKRALIAHQRYARAKQFKRANRALKTIRSYLGRVIRDIMRNIKGEAELESAFAHPLMLARRLRQHQRGRKVYSLHAPEVECIGKGKAHRPYEFGGSDARIIMSPDEAALIRLWKEKRAEAEP